MGFIIVKTMLPWALTALALGLETVQALTALALGLETVQAHNSLGPCFFNYFQLFANDNQNQRSYYMYIQTVIAERMTV